MALPVIATRISVRQSWPRPHVSSIPPDHYAGSLKEFLQPIGIQRVSSSAADEGMPAA